MEMTLIKIENDSITLSDNPYAYYLDLDPTGEYLKIFYDPKMDGWDGNEEIISGEK